MALRAEGLGLAYVGSAADADDATIDLVAEEAIDQSVARVSVVIPTLNEERNLPHVLERIPNWVDEVLVVDGLSTDDTIAVARRCRPDVRVVLESTKGKGAALRVGFRAATGHILVMLDADGSTDPREIPTFVGALLSGADVAVGSRFAQGGGTDDMERHRKLGNWVFTLARARRLPRPLLRPLLRLHRVLERRVAVHRRRLHRLRGRDAHPHPRTTSLAQGRGGAELRVEAHSRHQQPAHDSGRRAQCCVRSSRSGSRITWAPAHRSRCSSTASRARGLTRRRSATRPTSR